ncbi:uncharacterized protein LOC144578709 [Callithrix jacchus]
MQRARARRERSQLAQEGRQCLRLGAAVTREWLCRSVQLNLHTEDVAQSECMKSRCVTQAGVQGCDLGPLPPPPPGFRQDGRIGTALVCSSQRDQHRRWLISAFPTELAG